MAIAPTTQQRDWVKAASPPWLATGNGERFMYTLGLASDLLLEKCNQAIKIRMPGQGDPTQIPYLANDRVLVQGPAETNAQFIARLSGAFKAWKKSGSRPAVLAQLQAYLQNLQPGVIAANPEMAIVGASTVFSATAWDTIYYNTPLGGPPAHALKLGNWNWDGTIKPWRSWLILYMHPVPTGQSGSAASITGSAFSGSLLGQNVNGVWVPQTVGTPVNTPWWIVSGLSGLSVANQGQWIKISGAATSGNNGFFPIVNVASATTCVVANTSGSSPDANNRSIAWSISSYPYIGPAMPWGAQNKGPWNNRVAIASQANTTPGLATPTAGSIGQVTGSAWAPPPGQSFSSVQSMGLTCSTYVIQSIRQILQRWKACKTYYPYILVSFAGGDGTAGSEFSPNSSSGAGNPNGTWGSPGMNVNGVWVNARQSVSPFTCLCDGSAVYYNCSVPNQN